MANLILSEVKDDIGIITLNRPDRYNSLVPDLLVEFIQCFSLLENDPSAKVIIFKANGPVFSTGGDLQGFKDHFIDIEAYSQKLVGLLNQSILAILKSKLPVVCEVHGMVTGGSLGMKALETINPVLQPEDLLKAQELVLRVPVADQVVGYAMSLVRASRPGADAWSRHKAGSESAESITRWINWGAGPRGVLTLISCAKARALIHGRYHASMEDVNWVIGPSLRHRIGPNYAALASGITSEEIIDMLLEQVPADKEYSVPVA